MNYSTVRQVVSRRERVLIRNRREERAEAERDRPRMSAAVFAQILADTLGDELGARAYSDHIRERRGQR